jgi:hypothetical protein
MTTVPEIQNSRDRVLFNKIVFDQLKDNILIPTIPTKFNKNHLLYKLHKPFYKLITNFVAKKTNNTVFFDSVLFSVLLFAYPLFLFILFLVLKLFQFPTTIILIILVAVPIITKGVQE